MPLKPGTSLGPYEVVSLLGVGGMGEVYRARDTKLNRDVALKILPEAFTLDSDRIARFRREAQVLASLNHPNIAAIYGFEDSGRTHALVLELVEGPTLADRIAQGAVPLDDALPIARQIAEALEAAHEQGIMHRDLKPANIKVRPDGTVKVLDFGLAKAFDPAPSAGAAMTDSPTLSMQATFAGVILGTAAYMSPEQASGKPIDKRSDIWSFGVVLWEMLMGARLFEAETISHTLADVLRAGIRFEQFPAETPPVIRELLRRCLDRDVKRRLRDIGEARLAIERAIADPQSGVVSAAAGSIATAPRPWRRRGGPLVASALVGAALSGLVAFTVKQPAPSPIVTRFTIALPGEQQFDIADRNPVAVSPDGTQIVYAANGRLFRKALWEPEATPIAGTATDLPLGVVLNPVFSPDGRWIAYYERMPGGGVIQKIPTGGGAPITLTRTFGNPFGISWTADGILLGLGAQGIQRVSVNGGAPERLLSVKAGEGAMHPQMLPGGDAVLYTRFSVESASSIGDAEVVVRSLKSGVEKTVIKTGSDALYLPTGHIVYAAGGVLFAAPFDLKRQTPSEPVPVVEGVRRGGNGRSAYFSVSAAGVLVYAPGPASLSLAQQDIALIDRSGKVEPLKLTSASYEAPRVSPNGKQIVVGSIEDKEAVIWVDDLSGDTSTRRLTFGGRSRFPIWSPDGERVAFQSDREGDLAIWAQRADGTGTAERLTKPAQGASHVPDSWWGDRLLFSETKGTEVSPWTLSVRDKKVTPFSDIRSSLPINAVFSPDGKWVAYQQGRAGDNAVYVQPFPATGAKYQISKGLGHHPLWSPSGKEIVYLPAQEPPLVVSVNMQPSFSVGNAPVQLPRRSNEGGPATIRNYDLMPDGRFVGVVNAGQPPPGTPGAQRIQVVLNWLEELKQNVPTK